MNLVPTTVKDRVFKSHRVHSAHSDFFLAKKIDERKAREGELPKFEKNQSA